MGLHQAGYDVVGVDIRAMPRYPFRFIQDDAMAWLRGEREPLESFDLIHASPPCPRYSQITRCAGTAEQHPDLVPEVRERLRASGVPYIIENVVGAPLNNAIMLCGTMFGLLVVRHRLFETSPPIYFPPGPCAHVRRVVKHGRPPDRNKHYAAVTGHFSDVAFAREAMGIDWMTQAELADAIPPAYSRFLGERVRESVV
jgi:DNA (cytosine-5)-methyltransferase 1